MKLKDAKPNVRIRCTNAEFTSRKTDPYPIHEIALPEEGKEYTIRTVVETHVGPGLLLVEVRNKEYNHSKGGRGEPCFSLLRFELA